jgi:hypothetical protein
MCVYTKISISLKVSELDKSRENTPEDDDNYNNVNVTVGF